MKVVVVAMCLLNVVAYSSVKPLDSVRVYVASNGAKITILTAQSSKQFVIAKYEGTQTNLDGLTLSHDIETQSDKTEYTLNYTSGKKYYLSISKRSWEALTFFGGEKPLSLRYSSKLSEKISAADFLKSHITPRSKSMSANDIKATFEKRLQDFNAKMKKDCGFSMPVVLEVSEFPKDVQESFPIEESCIESLNPLLKICTEHHGKAELKKAVTAIACTYKESPGMELSKGKLRLYLSDDTSSRAFGVQLYLLDVI